MKKLAILILMLTACSLEINVEYKPVEYSGEIIHSEFTEHWLNSDFREVGIEMKNGHKVLFNSYERGRNYKELVRIQTLYILGDAITVSWLERVEVEEDNAPVNK